MRQLSPRLGYYIVSVGTVFEFLGLAGGSWSSDSSSGRGAFSFSHPGDVLLVIGLAITVLGLVIGFLSLTEELSHDIHRTPRLLPALPLVLLAGLAIGSVAFAYQAGGGGSSGPSQASAAATTPEGPAATATSVLPSETPTCPPGTFWLASTQQCLSLEVDANGNRTVATPVPPGATPVCPANTVWHPEGNHCLSTVCPAGFAFNSALFECIRTSPNLATPGGGDPNATPVCPGGTVWHPEGNHCLSTECPPGSQFDYSYFICVAGGGPTPTRTPTPTSTPTLPPGVTPTATPTGGPPPTPTATPYPSCPEGYFWHPAMGHCMSTTCPPGLVWDADGLYCVLPSTGSPTLTPSATQTPASTATLEPTTSPTPTGTPLPSCPAGYFWHPAMGHCMSTTCPPGLVWDADGLYCVLP